MLAKVFSAAVVGLDAVPVEVEVDIASQGLPSFTIVGFPDKAVEEAKERVRSAIRNSGADFPAKCMLIASQNPCPCGYLGDKTHRCICTSTQISRYKKKISGPLLDRIDIHLDIPAVKVEKLTEQDTKHVENSQTVKARVQKARDKQSKRYKGTSITSNAELTNKTIKIYCSLSDDCINLLRQAVTKMGLSGRAYYRIIKLSRTIADLEDTEIISPQHIAEALQYRPKGAEY